MEGNGKNGSLDRTNAAAGRWRLLRGASHAVFAANLL
jgi:hypothetical protein